MLPRKQSQVETDASCSKATRSDPFACRKTGYLSAAFAFDFGALLALAFALALLLVSVASELLPLEFFGVPAVDPEVDLICLAGCEQGRMG